MIHSKKLILASILCLLVANCSTVQQDRTVRNGIASTNNRGSIAYPALRGDRWDLHLVDPRTGQDKIITQDLDNVLPYFDWSPDGSRIVLTTGTNYYDQELFLVDVASGATSRLTNNQTMDENPDWSPNGEWIAFQSGVEADGGSKIWLIDPDSGATREVLNDPSIDENALSEPLWSPDMSMICTSGYAGISPSTIGLLIVDVDSGQVLNSFVHDGAEIRHPSWSPDSQNIAFVSNREGTYDVYVSSASDPGQKPIRLTQLPDQERLVSWSPDGKRLLFTAYLGDELPSYDHKIYTIDVETRELHQLTERQTMVGVGWSPDGQKIVTVAVKDDTHFVGIMNPDGSGLEILKETASDNMWPPKWGPALE